MKKYYTVYKTTNITNDMIYIGIHATNNLEDGYLGSGRDMVIAIKEFGRSNFKKDILFVFEKIRKTKVAKVIGNILGMIINSREM